MAAGRTRPIPKTRNWTDIVRDIAAIPDQNREKEHAVRLLLGAIRSLPEPDQDAVLALLLQGLSDNATWETAVRHSDLRRRGELALRGTLGMRVGGMFEAERQLAPHADTRTVPIRFPAPLHEQLKAWCEQHHFPMAAVVRGLVERFLESQGLP